MLSLLFFWPRTVWECRLRPVNRRCIFETFFCDTPPASENPDPAAPCTIESRGESMQPISFSLAVETITYGQHIPKPFVQSRKGQQRPLRDNNIYIY